jgi:GTPase involved in cell partitioning and DNA repair
MVYFTIIRPLEAALSPEGGAGGGENDDGRNGADVEVEVEVGSDLGEETHDSWRNDPVPEMVGNIEEQ